MCLSNKIKKKERTYRRLMTQIRTFMNVNKIFIGFQPFELYLTFNFFFSLSLSFSIAIYFHLLQSMLNEFSPEFFILCHSKMSYI